MFKTSFYLGLFIVSSLLFLVSCEEDEVLVEMKNPPADAIQESEAFVDGELVHRMEVSENHVVDFYQLKDGMTLVRESMPVDSVELPLMDRVEGGANLSEAYLAMSTDTVEAPASLLRADEIRKQALMLLEKQQITEPSIERIEAKAEHLTVNIRPNSTAAPTITRMAGESSGF